MPSPLPPSSWSIIYRNGNDAMREDVSNFLFCCIQRNVMLNHYRISKKWTCLRHIENWSTYFVIGTWHGQCIYIVRIINIYFFIISSVYSIFNYSIIPTSIYLFSLNKQNDARDKWWKELWWLNNTQDAPFFNNYSLVLIEMDHVMFTQIE